MEKHPEDIWPNRSAELRGYRARFDTRAREVVDVFFSLFLWVQPRVKIERSDVVHIPASTSYALDPVHRCAIMARPLTQIVANKGDGLKRARDQWTHNQSLPPRYG
jgi:hypothetical protein